MQKFQIAAYLRLSKEEYNSDKESNSITNQRLIIDKYLKNHKEYKLVDYYINDGYTGTNFNRPEFKRLLENIRDKKIDTIIIKDLSRLGRNYIEVGNYIETIFPSMGVNVIAVNEDVKIDTESYYVDDMVTFKNLTNDFYAKDISKKVRSTFRTKKLNGEFIGKLAPYGYIKDSNDKHKFLIDRDVVYIIKKIFNMILDGKSRKEVAEFLNNNDILTPSEYLKINANRDMTVKKKWNSEMVNKILRNENYTGTLIQGKRTKLNYRVNKKINVDKEDWIVTENHHEAIIDKETFDKVQDILDNHITRTNKSGNLDALSGFIKCHNCNGQMILKIGKNKSYYYCTNYFKKKCTSHSIEKSKLENMILDELKIDKLTRKYMYEKVNAIYIKNDKTMKVDFKI